MEHNIPRIIHYFWFGNNPKPEIVNKCIASWRKHMPDWEIKEWNERNYDIHCCEYVERAYEERKWAFVSDYARFDILDRVGGLYLDTDVEIIRKIPDEFFENPFTAVDINGVVAPGLIIALPQHHWLSIKALESYRGDTFSSGKNNSETTVNTRIKKILMDKDYEVKDDYQYLDQLIIYPSTLFCGYDVNTHEYAITDQTLSVHHYASSWMTERQLYKRKIQIVIKQVLGIEGYKKLLQIKRKLLGVSKE